MEKILTEMDVEIEGYRKVTEKEFFKALKGQEAKGRDIMPKIISNKWSREFGYKSEWAESSYFNRKPFGYSTSDLSMQGGKPAIYWITK